MMQTLQKQGLSKSANVWALAKVPSLWGICEVQNRKPNMTEKCIKGVGRDGIIGYETQK